jgi:hypothetical protein
MSQGFDVLTLFFAQAGGQIIWDYAISSFAVDLYIGKYGQLQLGLEVVAIIFLMCSTVLLLNDLLKAIRGYTLLSYVLKPGNWFHWVHTALMWYGWWLWVQYYQTGSSFSMGASYPVLSDPQASARSFQTDRGQEVKYMALIDRIKNLSSISENYRSIAGFCAFLFVFSLLESFRFQPRLGLISRTLEVAAPDLGNFAFLFLTIFGGFAVAATLLFGHQVFKVSSLDKSVVFLFFFMISLDWTQCWDQVMSIGFAPPFLSHAHRGNGFPSSATPLRRGSSSCGCGSSSSSSGSASSTCFWRS